MAGSSFGEAFRISTWGESHGAALGVVVDGVPAGLRLDTNRIQEFMDRRKPGQSKFTTARKEADAIEILSGVFEGKTTGTPISMMVRNADQHSKDYSNIAEIFRPGMRITLFMKNMESEIIAAAADPAAERRLAGSRQGRSPYRF